MSQYYHYTVVGSRIRVIASNPSVSTVVPAYFGVATLATSTFPYSTSEDTIESDEGRYAKLVSSQNNSARNNTITRYWSARKYFGKMFVVGADKYRGNVGANPSEAANFGVWVGSVGNTDGGNIYCTVIIDYIAVFTEPKYLGPS